METKMKRAVQDNGSRDDIRVRNFLCAPQGFVCLSLQTLLLLLRRSII